MENGTRTHGKTGIRDPAMTPGERLFTRVDAWVRPIRQFEACLARFPETERGCCGGYVCRCGSLGQAASDPLCGGIKLPGLSVSAEIVVVKQGLGSGGAQKQFSGYGGSCQVQ